ncbi:MAG: ImmA/IrrE family metallo-endopeptidase [Magnetococcales bacterium]|nr:ImmA/IrrE family metallo-endopeptidase [Magnetococcales bacterium]
MVGFDGVKVPPLSRVNIREFAFKFREAIGLEKQLFFPVVEIFENISQIWKGWEFDVATEKEMNGAEGHTFTEKKVIQIREDVFERATLRHGRDRMTIAHELGHVHLHQNVSPMYCRGVNIKRFENSEWQANCYGGELLISFHLRHQLGRHDDIVEKCCVSEQAAEIHWKIFNNMA